MSRSISTVADAWRPAASVTAQETQNGTASTTVGATSTFGRERTRKVLFALHGPHSPLAPAVRTCQSTFSPAENAFLRDCAGPATSATTHSPPSTAVRTWALVWAEPSFGLWAQRISGAPAAASRHAPACGAVRLGAAGAQAAATHGPQAPHDDHPSAFASRAE